MFRKDFIRKAKSGKTVSFHVIDENGEICHSVRFNPNLMNEYDVSEYLFQEGVYPYAPKVIKES